MRTIQVYSVRLLAELAAELTKQGLAFEATETTDGFTVEIKGY